MNRKILLYVLSAVSLAEGIMLLITSAVAAIYKEEIFTLYFLFGLMSIFLGYFGLRKKPSNTIFFAKEGFLSVALGWIFISLVGALPLFLSGEIPHYTDAVFEVISGFTTTGSSILPEVEKLSHASLFWRSFTHLFGGMGVLVIVLAFMPNISSNGMYIMRAESPGPDVGKFVSKVSVTSRILYAIYLGMTALEILILRISGVGVFDAVNMAFETAGTGGFSIYNASLAGQSDIVLTVVGIFMLLFGVNFNVYYFFLIKKAKEAFKCEELRIYFGIVAVSVLLITWNTLSIYQSLPKALLMAFFHVSSIITTTGFGADDFNLWPTFSKTILIMLMFCGACAGSTGGGIKVSRIAIMVKDSVNQLKQLAHPRTVRPIRFEGKKVDKEMVYSIRSYFILYVFVFFLSLLIISLDNFDFTTNFSAVAATLNNIGPGLNMVGPTSNFSCYSDLSKIVLMLDMLAGRLELVPMLVLFSPSTYKN